MDNKKVYDFIKGNLINFIIILTSASYILYGMINIDKTQLSVWEVIAKGGIGLIVGFMIKQSMGENGFNYGYRSQIWSDNLQKYNACCNEANPYLEREDNFYFSEEIEKKKNYRVTNMMSARMQYQWFFDNNGNYIENKERYEKLTKKQKKVLHKCVKVKIYNLNLFSEYSALVSADTKREYTDKDQRAKMFGKNGVAQIITAIAGAYFTATWGGWNWAEFITSTVQVAIWISCGITQLYTNYNYVVIEKISKLTRKKELILKFKSGCEKGLYTSNPYDRLIEVKENENVETNSVPTI